VVVTPEARRDALAMIAREHILSRRDLLDTMGRPDRLRASSEPDTTRLMNVGRAVLAAMPEDLASRFPEFTEGDDGMVGVFLPGIGVLLALKELAAGDGSSWITAVCGTVYHGADEVVGGISESVNVLVNRLNLNDTGAAWSTSTVGDTRMVVRLCGTAHRVDEGLHEWFELVAYLLVSAIAASERGSEELGPGTSYLELLARADDVEGFAVEEIEEAAAAFRRSFPPDLARVVLLERVEDGVGVSIPFTAGGEVHALTVIATVGEREDGGRCESGLRIFSGFYVDMPVRDAYRWTRAFNGDDDTPDLDDVWDQTTPWLLGAWQTLEVEPDRAAVLYRGFVPDALHRHASAEEIIRGALREVWVSANRYRLHKEFEETMRSADVAL
jgi:hypothetical protein